MLPLYIGSPLRSKHEDPWYQAYVRRRSPDNLVPLPLQSAPPPWLIFSFAQATVYKFRMGSPKDQREASGGLKKNRKGRLAEKASSFHGRGGEVVAEMLPRPRTVPDLLSGARTGGNKADEMMTRGRTAKLTKLLLNVTLQRSLGPVQVLISLEATVEDLIGAALCQYAKEARRKILSSDASAFDLHYSQFSLESLDRAAKIQELGSRNFFLCPKMAAAVESAGCAVMTSNSSCSSQADVGRKKVIPCLKFMDFSL